MADVVSDGVSVTVFIDAHDAGLLVHAVPDADPEDRAEAVERE